MTPLQNRLDQLGLLRYHDAFVSEGFDTWETLQEITESDLSALDVKLGHRRKLQRAIADAKGQPIATLRTTSSTDEPYRSDDSGGENRSSRNRTTALRGGGGTSTKRKYRRHPKPDENAPERPPSAYVIFSNKTRDSLKGQDLSFTEIAKLVGERWQQLTPEEREPFEREATAAKEKYYAQLAEYKKTPQYKEYQDYVADFRAKYPAQPQATKKANVQNLKPRQVFQLEVAAMRSPKDLADASAVGQKQSLIDIHARARVLQLAYTQIHRHYRIQHRRRRSPLEHSSLQQATENTRQYLSRQYQILSNYEDYIQASPRHANIDWIVLIKPIKTSRPKYRTIFSHPNRQEVGALVSSGYTSHPYQAAQLPQTEAAKPHPHRLLPAPVPTPGAMPSPLDPTRPSLSTSFAIASQDPRQSNPLAVLLRAGELARESESRSEESNLRKEPPDHPP
ncbi:MAG: hypothetical protein M1821_006442 [Bathelium mastoideum]|nr:MAG: hypothetical protein M1821_006442 [Bathelium mastoideum]